MSSFRSSKSSLKRFCCSFHTKLSTEKHHNNCRFSLSIITDYISDYCANLVTIFVICSTSWLIAFYFHRLTDSLLNLPLCYLTSTSLPTPLPSITSWLYQNHQWNVTFRPKKVFSHSKSIKTISKSFTIHVFKGYPIWPLWMKAQTLQIPQILWSTHQWWIRRWISITFSPAFNRTHRICSRIIRTLTARCRCQWRSTHRCQRQIHSSALRVCQIKDHPLFSMINNNNRFFHDAHQSHHNQSTHLDRHHHPFRSSLMTAIQWTSPHII